MARYVLQLEYADPDLRAQVRPEHLDYVASLHESGRGLRRDLSTTGTAR